MISEAAERRLGLAIVIGSMLAVAVALILAVPLFMTVDDGKYIGIGRNLLAGRGPITVFGEFFPVHAPLWPLIIAVPSSWLGIDVTAWAHALQVLSAMAIVGLSGILAWRVRPLATVIAAPLVVAFGPLIDLGRGMGLDLPAAAMILAYLVVAFSALHRGSARRGALAGAMLAGAFLIKEIALPFAPVPFLAALIVGAPRAVLARVAGVTILVTLAGVAWWFALFAAEMGEVYRLGTPAWTLPFIGLAGMAVGIGLVFLGRRWATDPASAGRLPPALGWGLTVGWVVALTAFFALTRFALGQGFLEPEQVLSYVRAHAQEMAPPLVFGVWGLGLLLAFGVSDRARQGVIELVVALLAGIPLVLLVVSIGELPRHYVVQTSILVVVGAAGTVRLLDRLAESPDRPSVGAALMASVAIGPIFLAAASVRSITPLLAASTALAGLGAMVVAIVTIRRFGRGAAFGRFVRPIAIAGVLVLAVAVVGINTVRVSRANPRDAAIREAVETTGAWVRANVPAGETVAYGAILAYESAVELQPTHPAVQIRELQDVQFQASAPIGVGRAGHPVADDWIVLATAPLRTDLLYGYRASILEAEIRARGATIWVQSVKAGSDDRVERLIMEWLASAPGIERLASWTFEGGATTAIFRIDPASLRLSADRLLVSPDALRYLVRNLRRVDPTAAAAIAGRLLDRAEILPASADGQALLDDLMAIAAR